MKKSFIFFLVHSCFVVLGVYHEGWLISGSCLSYRQQYQKYLKGLPQGEKDKLLLDNAKRNVNGSLEGNLLNLIQVGANMHTRGLLDRTILHEAVIAGSVSSVEFFLRQGVSCNVLDFYSCSPLHYAARGCDIASARLLLGAGASKLLRNKSGHTPEVEAKLSGGGPKIDSFLKVLDRYKTVDRVG